MCLKLEKLELWPSPRLLQTYSTIHPAPYILSYKSCCSTIIYVFIDLIFGFDSDV